MAWQVVQKRALFHGHRPEWSSSIAAALLANDNGKGGSNVNAVIAGFRALRDRASKRLSDQGRRICFAHVPKCGGTSVANALRNTYGLVDRTLIPETHIYLRASEQAAALFDRPMMELREEILAYSLAQQATRLVMGHVPCTPALVNRFSREWRFVTLLRNPVERFISEYVYNSLKESNWARTDMKPEEYLRSEKALASATSFLRYFSEFTLASSDAERDFVDDAVVNLQRFAVVGVLEELPAFARDFRGCFGITLKIPKRNMSPSARLKSDMHQSASLMDEVHRLCESDLLVYERMRDIILRV